MEAALKNRVTSFVIDGEAVLLGVDGISDFNGLHSRQNGCKFAGNNDPLRGDIAFNSDPS